jgi:two-component system response regulator YesN
MVAKSNSVFIRFFISYVVILFIPITIGSYAYWEAIKVVEQDASDLNMAVLEQGRDVVDGYLNEINSTARQMALNLRTNKVMYISKSVKTTDIYTIMELQKMLSSYILTNDFLKYYYIYFKNGDIIITPDTFYSSPKTFYNHYFPQNDLDYKDWHANLSNTFYYQTFVPGVNAYINKREVPSVLYLQSIPLTGLIPNGYISILIPEKAIEKSLSPIYSKGGGWFYVIDENEKVVTSALPDTESIQEINLKSIEEGKSSV